MAERLTGQSKQIAQTEQHVLPGMQEVLGVSRDITSIPVSFLEKPSDYKETGARVMQRLVVNLGLASSMEEARSEMVIWSRPTRGSFFTEGDVTATKNHVAELLKSSDMESELSARFESIYGVPLTKESLDALHLRSYHGETSVERTHDERELDIEVTREKDSRMIYMLNSIYINRAIGNFSETK